jgi:hypothetical protein
MEAKDLVALIVIVGVVIALVFKTLTSDQALAVIMTVLGYYFGYKQGYGEGFGRARQLPSEREQPSRSS